ncbi:PEP-CTERM sorting domain-containing protein [Aeoliella mucimassa]|uniref:Putative lipoprotein n=1 Tax=Aeoliella mucimassa TaxID=2527972 RepID=A0A518AH89_9BACT|nr:PEP-CTERM sorting domain-containing protein [Aeoliella mucimassa]QDU54054.1 putative lipoprotein [Aeoliella mucimassa]
MPRSTLLRYAATLVPPLMVALATILLAPIPADAEVTWSGNINPESPRLDDENNFIRVGDVSGGTLSITDWSNFSSYYTYLGYEADASGIVSVDGFATRFISYDTFVGYRGNGVLSITNGATGLFAKTIIADESASTGSASIDGRGTRWNGWELIVGNEGTGTLAINNGAVIRINGDTTVAAMSGSTGQIYFDNGTLFTQSLLAATNDLLGSGSINTQGLVSDFDLVFDANNGPNKSLVLDDLPGQNIHIQLDYDGSGALGAGYSGQGTLTIADGQNIESSYGYLGYREGSSGSAVIEGPDSSWTTYRLYVGYGGAGSLAILDGNHVDVKRDTYVGTRSGSSGNIIFDQGTLTTSTLYVNPNDLTGTGTINTHGLVSDIDLKFDAENGYAQTFLLNDSPNQDITLNLLRALTLGVGYRETASMEITEGQRIHSTTGYLGYLPDSHGSASIDGTGSTWSIRMYDNYFTHTLHVGHYGEGAISVTNGGTLFTSDAIVGNEAGSSGLVSVDGAGSGWVNDPDDYILGSTVIGNSGQGTVNLTRGGIAQSYRGILGNNLGSTGQVSVDGAGSSWAIQSVFSSYGDLTIGNQGTGSLSITNGGFVSNELATVGKQLDGSGTVLVDGEGSLWENTSSLYLGLRGEGRLTISQGGMVTVAEETWVGGDSAWDGTLPRPTGSIHFDDGVLSTQSLVAAAADLTGTGVIFTQGLLSDLSLTFDATHGRQQVVTMNQLPDQHLTIGLNLADGTILGAGYGGVGSLTIADQVTILSSEGHIGYLPGASGTAMVRDATWNIAGELNVGRQGNGTLLLSNGAQVESTEGYIGRYAGSSGLVSLSGEDTTWQIGGRFNLGDQGNASLTITNGAILTTGDSDVGDTVGSVGTAMISGQGSTWLGYDLSLGNEGTGIITIADGGVLYSYESYIGDTANGHGSISVDGASSLWKNYQGNSVYLGHQGTGTLFVTSGATASSSTTYVGYDTSASGTIAIDGLGSSWNAGELTLGNAGTATLHVTNGASVKSTNAYLGREVGSTALATVDGTGSSWTTTQSLTIGNRGQGTLSITNGAKVSSLSATLGSEQEASGAVTLDGPNSSWNIDGDLNVGYQGKGTLSIKRDAKVSVTGSTWVSSEQRDNGTLSFYNGLLTTGTLLAGAEHLTGKGTIYAHSLVSDVDLAFDATHGHQQTFSMQKLPGQAIDIHLDYVDGLPLGAGYGGRGSLTIADGKQIESSTGYLGYHQGASGAALVDGPESRWTLTENLYVGNQGNGVLSITNGASVEVANETWLGAGPRGSGSIHFDNGTLSTFWLYASAKDLTGTGTIDTQYLFADIDLVFDDQHPWDGSIRLNDLPDQDITINLTHYVTLGKVGIGYRNTGSLTITNQNTNINRLYLGHLPGSFGKATIQGEEITMYSNYECYVGVGGNGLLEIIDGAQVGHEKVYIGSEAGSDGRVVMSGLETKWYVRDIFVGDHGQGTLEVTDGSYVKSGDTVIGNEVDSTGLITVTGPGSSFISDSYSHYPRITGLPVGYRGSGTLSVTNGGYVQAVNCVIGYSPGSTGQVYVDGSESLFYTPDLYIGYQGDGTVTIVNEGTLKSREIHIGYEKGSTGMMIVDGIGSITEPISLDVGYHGIGTLQIVNGGTVNAGQGNIADKSHVLVDGKGSMLALSSLSTWGQGRSESISPTSLSITNGGYLSTNSLRLIASVVTQVDGIDSIVDVKQLSLASTSNTTTTIANGGLICVSDTLSIGYGRSGKPYQYNAIQLTSGGMLALAGEGDDSLADFMSLVLTTNDYEVSNLLYYWDSAEEDWALLEQASYGTDYTLAYHSTGSLAGYTVLTVGRVPEPSTALLTLASIAGGWIAVRRRRLGSLR